jgi:hypothetical protein
MELQEIQLTEADFNLLIEGLDSLPEKGAAGLIMASLTGKLMAGDNPRHQAEVDKAIARHEKEHEARKKAIDEDIALLKGKLILLKRYLVTNGALKTVNKIVGNE